MKIITVLTVLFAFSLNAEVLKRNEAGDFILTKNKFKVRELITDYGRLMNYNLSVDKYLKDDSFETQGEMLIPKDQIENYISTILTHTGNAIIKMPDSKFANIIIARDIRYSTVPIYTKPEQIPANDHQAQFTHTLKYLESGELARNMRPFISRYGRIIDVKNSNTIHITDSGNNLRRIAQIAIHLDTEEYLKDKMEMLEINKKNKRSSTTSKSFLEILNQNQMIFIVIFLLIGIIIGFGSRGYMMKKVEGGW